MPIAMGESGTIFEIKRFALHDGPGLRTTVFFKGCPLCCCWCQNPESQRPEPEPYDMGYGYGRSYSTAIDSTHAIGRRVTLAHVMREIEKDILFYDESGGGITFSGGEPLMQPEFLHVLLRRCQDIGIPKNSEI
jgi:pyruvate formate lyase activating enzyme